MSVNVCACVFEMFNSSHRAAKDKREIWVLEVCACLGGWGYPVFAGVFVCGLSMPSVK